MMCETLASAQFLKPLLSDQQTSLKQEHTASEYSGEDVENLREQTTVNVLQRWAEPLEQYLNNLQKFVS